MVLLYHTRLTGLELKEVSQYIKDYIDCLKDTRTSVQSKIVTWTSEELELRQALGEMVNIYNDEKKKHDEEQRAKKKQLEEQELERKRKEEEQKQIQEAKEKEIQLNAEKQL